MQIWKRRRQEHFGTYQFSGTFIVTHEVMDKLSLQEILTIYLDIQMQVKLSGGLHYFQVYENETGDRLYFIDELEPEMMVDNSIPNEDNYCTLLFSHEY